MTPDYSFKLRIYFSVDLVGSTAFKASEAQSEFPDWARTFEQFFTDFPDLLKVQYDHLPSLAPKPKNFATPWKCNGDEILFCAQLTDHKESIGHIIAMRQAIKGLDEKWSKQHGTRRPMKLKATAWLAGFPVNNAEVVLRVLDDQVIRDFIGPHIDLGFRLAQLADERKMPVSVDLADMLLNAMESLRCGEDECLLNYSGRTLLRGVNGGTPYPFFWVDMHNGEDSHEEKLTGYHRTFDRKVARSFITDYFKGQTIFRRPFIEGDPDRNYKEIPGKYLDRLTAIREQVQAEESNRNYSPDPQNGVPESGARREPLPPVLVSIPKKPKTKPKRNKGRK